MSAEAQEGSNRWLARNLGGWVPDLPASAGKSSEILLQYVWISWKFKSDEKARNFMAFQFFIIFSRFGKSGIHTHDRMYERFSDRFERFCCAVLSRCPRFEAVAVYRICRRSVSLHVSVKRDCSRGDDQKIKPAPPATRKSSSYS